MKMNYAMFKSSFVKMAAAAMVLAVGFTACKDDEKVKPVDEAKVGVINLLEDVNKVNVHFSGKKINNAAVNAGAFSNYMSIKAANDNLIIFAEGKTDTLTKKKHDFKADQSYTAVVYGNEEEAHMEVFSDNLTAPANGKAKIRFANFAAGNEGLALFIGTATTATIDDVDFKEAKGFVEVEAANDLTLKVRANGSQTDLATLANTNLQAGKIYTVYLSKEEVDGNDELVLRMITNK